MPGIKSITKYSPMLAKVSVLNRCLLKASDYEELINKTDVSEAATFLKNQTAYAAVLNGGNESLMHREELEERLNDAFTIDFEKIYRFENADNKCFLSYVFIRSEIEVLKNILRRIENGRQDIFISVPPFLYRHYSIDIDKLTKSKGLRNFLENLSDSRYESLIRSHLTVEEHQNIFSVEAALDMYYYTQIGKLTDKIRSKEDKKAVSCAVGAEIDALNMLLIYRLKKFFRTDNELIYTYLIPNSFKLKKENIVRLISSKSVSEFLSFADKTPYKELFIGIEKDIYPEHRYKDFVYRLHRKQQMKHPFTIAYELAYLHMKEQEIKNITSIAEGIRYRLAPEQIKRYVVGVFDL